MADRALRLGIAALACSAAIGFPAFGVASALSTNGLTFTGVLGATVSTAMSAGIVTWIVHKPLREMWVAWVGLLGGVRPSSLALTPDDHRSVALTHALVGLAVAGLGVSTLVFQTRGGSVTWAFFGLVKILVGLGFGLAGAIPHAIWSRRTTPAQAADDVLGPRVSLFVWLAIVGLQLSSGFAETLPDALYREALVPLRTRAWARGCASREAPADSLCPSVRSYVVVATHTRPVAIEWKLSGPPCAIEIHTGDTGDTVVRSSERWDEHTVDMIEGRDVRVRVVGVGDALCWYSLRFVPEAPT